MAGSLTVTITAVNPSPWYWLIVVDGDAAHPVPAEGDVETSAALLAAPGFGVDGRVTIERRDPLKPLITGMVIGA
jgi:hypothetical protein